MNKTISANISGIIFNIEEQAYERLKQYLDAIRGHFANSEDRDEIMADIEARIAELFSERINDRKEVIGMADVTDIIAIMGQPEEYSDEEPVAEEEEAQTAGGGGGTIPGYGSGQRRTRRIFRDPDNSTVGGVCSGISHYFNWDPIWLRIFFVVMFLGFGTGLLFYIILWIVIPEAKTTAEKLEMRGERVNVENIGRAFDKGGRSGQDSFNQFADDLGNLDTEYHAHKAKAAFHTVMGYVGTFLKAFGKVFGAALIAASIAMMIVLISLLVGGDGFISITDNGIASFSYNDIADVIFISESHSTIAFIGLFLVIGVPVVSFLYTGIRLVFGMKSNYKPIGIALTSIWIVGALMCGYVALQTGTDFVGEAKIEQDFEIEQPVGDTLYLDVMNDPIFTNYFDTDDDWNMEYVNIDEDSISISDPRLDVWLTTDTAFSVLVKRESHGPNQKAAITLAEKIQYNIQQDGDRLSFGTYYSMDKDDLFRGQEVRIIVFCPIGKAVHFSRGMDRVIHDVDNVSRTYDSDMVGRTWTMTPTGLECIGCGLTYRRDVYDGYGNHRYREYYEEYDHARQNDGQNETQNDTINTSDEDVEENND